MTTPATAKKITAGNAAAKAPEDMAFPKVTTDAVASAFEPEIKSPHEKMGKKEYEARKRALHPELRRG